MFDFKITKIQKLKEVNCDMCHNFYFLVHFRMYNSDNTRQKKGKFVVCFDAFDVQEYFEQDYYTIDNVKTLACEFAYANLEAYYKSYDNTEELYEFCKQTIQDYNETNHNVNGNW